MEKCGRRRGGIRHGSPRGGARSGTAGVVRVWYIDKRRPPRRRDREASYLAISASLRTSLVNIPDASSTCDARRAIRNATGVRAVPVAVRSPACSIIPPQTHGKCGKSSLDTKTKQTSILPLDRAHRNQRTWSARRSASAWMGGGTRRSAAMRLRGRLRGRPTEHLRCGRIAIERGDPITLTLDASRLVLCRV
jgi:hypothetical protein